MKSFLNIVQKHNKFRHILTRKYYYGQKNKIKLFQIDSKYPTWCVIDLMINHEDVCKKFTHKQ